MWHNGGPPSLRTRYIYFCRSGGNQSAHCCVSRENLYTHTQNLSLHYSLHKTILQTHVRYSSVCSGGTSVWHARGKGVIKQWNYSGLLRKTPLTGHVPLLCPPQYYFQPSSGTQVEDALAKDRALYNRTWRTDGRTHKHRLMRETLINMINWAVSGKRLMLKRNIMCTRSHMYSGEMKWQSYLCVSECVVSKRWVK